MSDFSLLREFDSLAEFRADELGEKAFTEDYYADFDKDDDELGFVDAFTPGFGGEGTESEYDRGYAEGSVYVASEIDDALGCEPFIDCDCRPHEIIRRVLVGFN